MGRLINADKLIEFFEKQKKEASKLHEVVFFDAVNAVIDTQPTAYDVEKVAKELKGMSGIQFDGRNESYELNWCISTDRAIEIVKGVVKDE